jgi:SAM-dependent methyltransferase
MKIANNARRHFDELFASSGDPWGYEHRWYEARKRALTLACLPKSRYARGYEPGCANGALSADLATRCERLLISDGAAEAVALAERRVAGLTHVSAFQALTPDEWPDGAFDLIVISEVAYYLDAAALSTLVTKAIQSLVPGGDIVACHWRHAIEDGHGYGDAVHEALARALPIPRIWSLVDPDFRLEVWSSDRRSIGEREGLVPGISSYERGGP